MARSRPARRGSCRRPLPPFVLPPLRRSRPRCDRTDPCRAPAPRRGATNREQHPPQRLRDPTSATSVDGALGADGDRSPAGRGAGWRFLSQRPLVKPGTGSARVHHQAMQGRAHHPAQPQSLLRLAQRQHPRTAARLTAIEFPRHGREIMTLPPAQSASVCNFLIQIVLIASVKPCPGPVRDFRGRVFEGSGVRLLVVEECGLDRSRRGISRLDRLCRKEPDHDTD